MEMMSWPHKRFSTIWCLITLPIILSRSGAQETRLSVMEYSSPYRYGIVSLVCNSGMDGHDATFFKRDDEGGHVAQVEIPHSSEFNGLTFQLNATTEGIYYCEMRGERSTEMVLIGYPFSDPSIARNYSTTLGESLVVNCTIPVGILRERYSVRWFKGLVEINPSEPAFDHISIQQDFSLRFSDIRPSDESNAYSCVMNVARNNETVTRQGSTISISIRSPIEMENELNSMSVNVGSRVTFMCQARGVPVPKFRWLLNGTEYINEVTSTPELRSTNIHVTSTFTIPRVNESHTGAVTCIAYHIKNGEVATVASTANLVALTNNFVVVLSVQNNHVHIEATLPVPIVGVFSLKVRFYKSKTTEDAVLHHLSLMDTNIINLAIPDKQLPSFRDFTVAIAMVVRDEVGQFSSPSNRLVLPSTIRNPCDCSSATNSNNSIVVVLSVLIVLIVLAMLFLIIGCAFVYCRRSFIFKTTSDSSCDSLPRSASRSSYGSQGSRRSGRSSRSSHSRDRSSGCSNATDNKEEKQLEEIKEEEVEEPKDVRDYETIDHKKLKQWGESAPQFENTIHLGNIQSVRFTKEPEPVFPNTHTGATNRVATYYHGHRDSASPFEDLEEECLEFSTEVPRSC